MWGGAGTYTSHSELGSLVPAGEVVVDSREQAGLGEAQEPAGGHEAGVVGDEAHGQHAGAPEGAARWVSILRKGMEGKHGSEKKRFDAKEHHLVPTLSPRKHPHIRERACVGPVSRADKMAEELTR